MTRPCHSRCLPRPGFTLIELIVVISIIAFMAGLGVLLIPNLNEQQRAPRGAFMLQQTLMGARNRALRDGAPRGVRLLIDSSNPGFVKQVQYIEQPDDFIVLPGVAQDPFNATRFLPFRRIYSATTLVGGQTVQQIVLEAPVAGAPNPAPDFSGNTGIDRTLWPVQPGDYLEINGGLPHLITSMPDALTLQLASTLPAQIPQANPVANYRILRTPRVSADDPIDLPDDIAIDLTTNTTYGNPLPTNTITDPVSGTTTTTIDILFAPSGAVVGRGTSTEAIYLWVRDTSLNLFEGDNTLVVVYVRTGMAAAYQVNDTQGQDPYAFAKNGRASGL
jgi:prepilin-type N-terminal cleavage/methylation domain-containing protein